MTISSGAGITASTSSAATVDTADSTGTDGVARNVTGWDGLTFATSGATIEIGTDVALADAVGDVSGVASDLVDVGMASSDAAGSAIPSDEGSGISLSTSVGAASVTIAYVADSSVDGDTVSDLNDATTSGASAKISTAVGPVGVTVAYVTHDSVSTNDTESAIAASYDSGMGTISVGYGSSTGATKGNETSVAYSMTLDADTSLSIGYGIFNTGAYDTTHTELALSRSLGGGASVFVEYINKGGDTGTTTAGETSSFAVGTSVSF